MKKDGTLLKTVVLRHIAQVRKYDDHGLVHFLYHDDSGEDSATDRHISGEGALLVDVTLAILNTVIPDKINSIFLL